jgi:hypothetical protein
VWNRIPYVPRFQECLTGLEAAIPPEADETSQIETKDDPILASFIFGHPGCGRDFFQN